MNQPQEKYMSLNSAILIALSAVCIIGLMTLLIFKGTELKADPIPAIAQEREEKLADTRAGMAKEMASYRLISKDKGTVQLPVSVAMEVTLKDLQSSAPRPTAVPVDPTASVPAPVEASEGEAETAIEPDAAVEQVTEAEAAGEPAEANEEETAETAEE